jgi:hypothetical protein
MIRLLTVKIFIPGAYRLTGSRSTLREMGGWYIRMVSFGAAVMGFARFQTGLPPGIFLSANLGPLARLSETGRNAKKQRPNERAFQFASSANSLRSGLNHCEVA